MIPDRADIVNPKTRFCRARMRKTPILNGLENSSKWRLLACWGVAHPRVPDKRPWALDGRSAGAGRGTAPAGAAGSLTTISRYRLVFEKVVQKHLGEGGWKSQIYGKAPLGVVIAGKSTGVLYGDQDFVADRLLGL